MAEVTAPQTVSESQFAALVHSFESDPAGREQLTDLLHETHPLYDQRGTAATVRMRGWVLLALARLGLPDRALLFVLEELDTGQDAYLIAAAARALRSYATPNPAFAPFVMRAIAKVRYKDEIVCFDGYGEYALSARGTSPVRELLATLIWLGPHARGILTELEALRASRDGLSNALRMEVRRAAEAIRAAVSIDEPLEDSCCPLPSGCGHARSWPAGGRRECESIHSTVFEDQDGARVTFGEFFRGRPSVVVFFYTRCDNPQKCSLTIAKLARLQQSLAQRGLANDVQTAAITYDPAFDVPARLANYGRGRGVRLDGRHRMLRAIEGVSTLRTHFGLGVNFIESLVNRHRVEVYILDAAGRIAASFERIHWEEQQVLDRAVELLNEEHPAALSHSISTLFAALVSFGAAFFPKCPVCWTVYLSVFGIAGLERIPYSPWLLPVLVGLMLVNLTSVWRRGRSTRRMSSFYFVAAGTVAIVVLKMGLGFEQVAPWGVALAIIGSLIGVLSFAKPSIAGAR